MEKTKNLLKFYKRNQIKLNELVFSFSFFLNKLGNRILKTNINENKIAVGSSRTFTLYNGIASGISDITVIFTGCLRKDRGAFLTARFEDGKNTTITINQSGIKHNYGS